jgi:hypothetical protein
VVAAEVVHDDPRTGFGEGQRFRATDPPTRSGHDRDLAVQLILTCHDGSYTVSTRGGSFV